MFGFKRFVRRKWGWYLVLLDRKHFKVKLLRFKERSELSLQYHQLRNELWLFLSGTGYFFTSSESLAPKRGDYIELSSSECHAVPIGYTHKYIALIPSIILEIQYGERCVEEDIVRL